MSDKEDEIKPLPPGGWPQWAHYHPVALVFVILFTFWGLVSLAEAITGHGCPNMIHIETTH